MVTLTAPRRLVGLDRLRGLAVAAMVVDHLALFAGVELLRVTVGRLAVPLFFVVAGALVTSRPRLRRVVWVALVGVALPVLAPWVDDPNVLVLYATGACLLALVLGACELAGRDPVPWLWGVLVVALTVDANRWTGDPDGYPFTAVLGLMVAGALLGRGRVHAAGAWLPGWVGALGRYPLTVYAGHVLAFTAVAGWLS